MIEGIASKIHSELWKPWAKTMINTEKLSQERIDRWNNECFKPYEELSEEMKEWDRIMARKLLPNLISNNSYLNDRKAIDRLKKEYLEHNNLIIGFDFDCTIFDYHKEGLELQPAIDLLKRCSDLGFTMCLYSLSEIDTFSLPKKEMYCNGFGIKVHFVNDSPLLRNQSDQYWKKPFFSILLDDRAGLSASYNILVMALNELGL